MWQEHTIEANGLTLHYHRTGGDKPPIVLLHGITDIGMCWIDVAKDLEADFDLIMPDVRGHGQSEVPESNDTFKPLVEDANALIKALKLENPILFGHSLGAITSLSLAGFYPDVPKAIILEDPPAWWISGVDTVEARKERVKGSEERLARLKTQTANELIKIQQKETPLWSDSELKYWAQSKQEVSAGVSALFGATDFLSWDWDNLMPSVSCPVLLIRADNDKGAIISPETAGKLKDYIPNLEVAYVAGAGHCIHRDKFDETMTVVKDFLKQI